MVSLSYPGGTLIKQRNEEELRREEAKDLAAANRINNYNIKSGRIVYPRGVV